MLPAPVPQLVAHAHEALSWLASSADVDVAADVILLFRPGSGLGIAYTTDISQGRFTQTNWTAGVPGGVGPWMKALGEAKQEIKLEAGAHMVELESGDLLHFYAAATPGWVNNGNYTSGYIILDKDDPTRIIQRGSGQFMVPTFDYETLCNHGNTPDPGKCKYTGERRNVIFMCSATRIGPNRFRLFFGGGDGNVSAAIFRLCKVDRLSSRSGHMILTKRAAGGYWSCNSLRPLGATHLLRTHWGCNQRSELHYNDHSAWSWCHPQTAGLLIIVLSIRQLSDLYPSLIARAGRPQRGRRDLSLRATRKRVTIEE